MPLLIPIAKEESLHHPRRRLHGGVGGVHRRLHHGNIISRELNPPLRNQFDVVRNAVIGIDRQTSTIVNCSGYGANMAKVLVAAVHNAQKVLLSTGTASVDALRTPSALKEGHGTAFGRQ